MNHTLLNDSTVFYNILFISIKKQHPNKHEHEIWTKFKFHVFLLFESKYSCLKESYLYIQKYINPFLRFKTSKIHKKMGNLL